jgi:hypothetical protein
MTTKEPKPVKGGKGDEANISKAIVELLKKKDEVGADNFLDFLKDSGLLEGFEEKIKRKYKLK